MVRKMPAGQGPAMLRMNFLKTRIVAATIALLFASVAWAQSVAHEWELEIAGDGPDFGNPSILVSQEVDPGPCVLL